MQVAKRYLDEIEEILDFTHKHATNDLRYLSEVLDEHWNMPMHYAGLFTYCRPAYTCFPCDCLTQIKENVKEGLFRSGIKDRNGQIISELTKELCEDTRIVSDSNKILPDHLRDLRYPLTVEQREEVRQVLLPYGEWQTRLRIEYQDYVNDLELQEV